MRRNNHRWFVRRWRTNHRTVSKLIELHPRTRSMRRRRNHHNGMLIPKTGIVVMNAGRVRRHHHSIHRDAVSCMIDRYNARARMRRHYLSIRSNTVSRMTDRWMTGMTSICLCLILVVQSLGTETDELKQLRAVGDRGGTTTCSK